MSLISPEGPLWLQGYHTAAVLRKFKLWLPIFAGHLLLRYTNR